MGKLQEEEMEDTQDLILQAMRSRKMRGNASYFAFTATPKNTTLEKFGQLQPDGTFQPFHLYSMKQAIEEGFILDVVANYTTYRSYYEISKSIEENPLFDSKKAQKKLRAYVEGSQETIDVKAEIMLEHFIPHVVNAKKLKGKGKGMVVTQSIVSAIRYYKAITRQLEAMGNPFKVLIAFSGSKEVDGVEYTEADLNGFAEGDTRDKFDTDEYRLLIVANKYLTGFDQPKLCAMYVDKKLNGVLCVQALSRLNRAAPKWGKKTEDLFILDFFNPVEEIKASFDPFAPKAAHFRLTHSRQPFVMVFPHETQEMLFAAHDAAFHYWGGVPRQGIYDNLKTCVDQVLEGKERRFNPRFLALMSHYVIEPVACTPASGWEKGQGEKQVQDVRRRCFTPPAQGRQPGRPQWQGSCRLIFSLGAGAVKWLITGLRLSLGREPSCI